jgi:hypothetical protein
MVAVPLSKIFNDLYDLPGAVLSFDWGYKIKNYWETFGFLSKPYDVGLNCICGWYKKRISALCTITIWFPLAISGTGVSDRNSHEWFAKTDYQNCF